MLRIFSAYIFIISVILTGCSTVEDPKENGGAISTAINLWKGTYNNRLKTKQEILDAHRLEGKQLDIETQKLEDIKLTIAQQFDIEEQKLQDINKVINQLEKDVKTEETALSANEQERQKNLRKLSGLKQKNKKLQKKLRVSRKNNASAKEIKILQEERDSLDKELNLLLDVLQ